MKTHIPFPRDGRSGIVVRVREGRTLRFDETRLYHGGDVVLVQPDRLKGLQHLVDLVDAAEPEEKKEAPKGPKKIEKKSEPDPVPEELPEEDPTEGDTEATNDPVIL